MRPCAPDSGGLRATDGGGKATDGAAARQAGADVWVHERDAAGLAGGARVASREAKPERSLLPYLIRRPATLRAIAYAGRMGGFTGSKVADPRTIDGDRP